MTKVEAETPKVLMVHGVPTQSFHSDKTEPYGLVCGREVLRPVAHATIYCSLLTSVNNIFTCVGRRDRTVHGAEPIKRAYL